MKCIDFCSLTTICLDSMFEHEDVFLYTELMPWVILTCRLLLIDFIQNAASAASRFMLIGFIPGIQNATDESSVCVLGQNQVKF